MPPEASSAEWPVLVGATVMGAALCAYLFPSLFHDQDTETASVVPAPSESPRVFVFSPVVNLHFDRARTPDPVPQFFESEPFLQRMDRSRAAPLPTPRIPLPWLEQPVILPRVQSLPFATIEDILAADRPDTPYPEDQARVHHLEAIAEGRAVPATPFEDQWRQYALDSAMREAHTGEWALYADGTFHFFSTYSAAEDHSVESGSAANLLLKVGDEFPGHAVLGQTRSESPLSTGSWQRVPSDPDLRSSTPSP